MTEAHPGYASVKDVARIYRVSIGYVYRLASAHAWRRYTMDGCVRYHRGDVDTTFHQVRSCDQSG